MSLFRTLDEIPSEELVKELSRRHYLRMSALKCPYCEKKLETDDVGFKDCVCRFGEIDKYHSPNILNPLRYST